MTKSHNYKILSLLLLSLAAAAALWSVSGSSERGGHLAERTNDPRRQFTLAADDYWRLTLPGSRRFDASGLVWFKGKLLTLSDRGPELFEIQTGNDHTGNLLPTKFFPVASVAKASPTRTGRYDCEGIAVDSRDRLYICEESQRAVFRTGADGSSVERLAIDWKPVTQFFRGSINASFEGITLGGGKLYLANERDVPRIIVVNPDTLEVEDSFFIDSIGFAFGGPHYSDLAFADGRLFVLDRNHRCILEVNPATKKVEAEYSFGEMELREDLAYITDYPTGTMEGLAVDDRYFWLVTDNNGRGRFKDRNDFRPTLFRCVRPRP